MNKLKLLEIMKQLILLKKQGILTGQTYQDAVNNVSDSTLSEDLLACKETEFICFIFRELPYYQILTFINDLCVKLNEIEKEKTPIDKKCLISLIVSYFSDLFFNINSRVNTEINVHIYKLLLQYYQNGTLNPEKTIANLKNNNCSPEVLTGLFIANDVLYEQTTLVGFERGQGELRDKISKSNYKRKSSIETSVQRNIVNFFDEDSFEKFLVALNNCFNAYYEKNPDDCNMLKDELMLSIRNFYHTAKKAWEKKQKVKEEESYQYQLNLFNI